MPSYIFYDNACQILKFLQGNNQHDHYFDNVGWVVDVFHAHQKHKDDHVFCQKFANPAGYPDLRRMEGGKEVWIFNSSAAEQANQWFGGFQPLVREMKRVKSVYFLTSSCPSVLQVAFPQVHVLFGRGNRCS